MVSKDEINDKVWRGRVVSEAALSSRIKLARQLLGDDGSVQRYIRTIHKRGFRFVGEAKVVDAAPPAALAPAAPQSDRAGPGNESSPAGNVVTARAAVAVLPMVNLSQDPAQDYFADGVTTDIISRLSRYHWLDVIARNTAFGYKGKSFDVRDLRAALAVDYVVEGTVQRSGERLRIGVQLIDARTGHSLWGERYDRALADLFEMQDEITETIVAGLEPEIGFAERNRVVHTRPANLQAWMHHLGTFTSSSSPGRTTARRSGCSCGASRWIRCWATPMPGGPTPPCSAWCTGTRPRRRTTWTTRCGPARRLCSSIRAMPPSLHCARVYGWPGANTRWPLPTMNRHYG
jgi:TolB-like protein